MNNGTIIRTILVVATCLNKVRRTGDGSQWDHLLLHYKKARG